MLVTKQLTVAIDLHSMEKIQCKSMATINNLVTNILQNIFFCVNQGWGTLILEGHSPAEFSSNPEKPWEKIPNCILKTLISCFRCVWLGLELNSAGHRPSRINVPHLWCKWWQNFHFWVNYRLNCFAYMNTVHITSSYIVKPIFIQTPSTFLTLSQFIRYSSENGNKIWQELRVKLCQNKFILIMSDNFDGKVCTEFGWIAVSC